MTDISGNFTWFRNHLWFIETKIGNFVWSDPKYPGGTGKINRCDGTLREFIAYAGCGRPEPRGNHIVTDYLDPVSLRYWQHRVDNLPLPPEENDDDWVEGDECPICGAFAPVDVLCDHYCTGYPSLEE